MENKEKRMVISVTQNGHHYSIGTTKAERDEMIAIMEERPGASKMGLDLWKEAQERLKAKEQALK